ncbi:hypothetical protein EV204_101334 [Tissierella praeacuta]|uniref:DUF6240 domain-containing protein n=1 Tax=Tissierella praeacuta TaxID=43131 RepID=UPI00104AA74C|nr:DUF6240 domain-containing protein [Tissierella praeacuta]TCU79353.1 hypothetical protein EV204_101334 [Tissierella praeacuta]
MEILKINNKENIINSYGLTPTLPYDIEGVLVEKDGKDIKIQKTIDNKTVEYSLRLKEEIVSSLGDNITVEKENIISSKVEEEEEVKEENKVRKASDIIRELGLEYTEENIRMIEFLLSSGIPITKGNVDSYIQSKEYLNKIIEGIDTNSFVKLSDRGIDLDGESLQKIAEALDDIKNENPSFSLRKLLRLEKDLTYKDAEEIAKEIYGQKMGKDVYDTIIALNKEKLPITRENIDKTIEVISKLHNLKELKEETYIKIFKDDMLFNIDNLYKLNNSYTINPIENNTAAKNFEGFTIAKETTIDGLKEILSNLNLDDNLENINILREFIVNDMVMDEEKYNKIISMKKSVKELIELLGHEEIAKLNKKDINPLEEPINQLVEELKKEDIGKLDKPLYNEEVEEIKRNLEILGKIKDKDLLMLIKNGEDFTLKSIKGIIDTNIDKELSLEYKTFDKTIHISNILNTLGDKLNIDTLSFALNKYDGITLNNLYMAQEEITTAGKAIPTVDRINEGLIFEEYLRARNNLTVNIVKESIKDSQTLEAMPLNELNNYIEKKINRYKESQRMTKEIKDIKGNHEKILPIIMKNQLPMTLKEIREINSFLNGEKGLGGVLKDVLQPNNPKYTEEFKEGIKLLQEKISTSIKNGDANFKDNYKELINFLNSNNSFDTNERQKSKEDEYIKLQSKISKKDMVFQLPVQIGNEYRSLNIIVPDAERGIDRNNMKFFISLETDNIGIVDIDLNVVGNQVKINIKEEGVSLRSNLALLEEGLQRFGYTLNKQAIL